MQLFPKKGIIAALVLPHDEAGDLKLKSLELHIDWLVQQGIHGILVNGSSAGFPLLTVMERKRAMREVTRLAGSIPVISNISDTDPRVVSELGQYAAAVGNCGVAILPHGYYKSNPADQVAWFKHAADASGLPVLLYNFPELAGNRIDEETIRMFADCAPLAGIKQSGGEIDYHGPLVELGRELAFSVFTGADTRLPELFPMGVAGCIGGMVNFVPEMMVRQFNMFVDGVRGEAEPDASRMQQVGALVSGQPFPDNVRYGMLARGFNPGAGMMILSEETHENLEQMRQGLKSLFNEWGLPQGPGIVSPGI